MKKLFAIAIILFFASQAFATTPTITNVTGTVATGQTLTITGTYMVEEVRTNWDSFFNATNSGFEGASLSADGYATSADVSYDSAVKLMGSKSIKAHMDTVVGPHPSMASDGAWQFNPTLGQTDLYFRTYSRFNATSWPSDNHKYWWLGGGATTLFLNFKVNGYNAPTQFGYIGGGDWLYGSIPSGAIQNERWYCIEMHVKKGGSSPYPVEVWVDGTRIIYTANDGAGYYENRDGWGWETNTNYAGTTSGFSLDHWQDGFAMSSTRIYPASKIEISNNSTYGSGTVVYQPPTFLSDTECTITANLTNLGAGPYYLWVTNNGQNRSLAYTLSGESGIPSVTNCAIQGVTPGQHQCAEAYWPVTPVTMACTTDIAATCKYDDTDTTYALMDSTFSTTGTTSHSQSITANCGQSYTYYVRCTAGGYDATSSYSVSFALDKDPPPKKTYNITLMRTDR